MPVGKSQMVLRSKRYLQGDIAYQNTFNFTARNPEAAEPQNNTLSQFNQQQFNYTWTNTLNYIKSFGKHNINALFGVEAVSNESNGFTASGTDFLFENREFLVLTNAQGGTVVTGAFQSENTLSSVFGSANYNYDSKYLLSATVRRDQIFTFCWR